MYHKYWLSSLYNVSAHVKLELFDYFGDAKAIYTASAKELVSTGLCSFEDAAKITDSRKTFNLYEFDTLEKSGISLVTIDSDKYPRMLLDIYDAPFGLFIKGKMPKNMEYPVGIVGARACSNYGNLSATEIAREISKKGGLVISGMARGIDSAGHVGALSVDAATVAVLGCGVDICYPPENQSIYEKIQEKGCIISECPPKTQPLPFLFPLRNRIISGLSKIVIVVEARNKSGSLITADTALEQGRDVYALPGKITDKLSEGCNRLIEEGAGIIVSVKSLLNTLMEDCVIPDTRTKAKSKKELANILNEREMEVVRFIDFEPKSLDMILSNCNIPLPEIFKTLRKLVEMGVIRESAPGLYQKNTIKVLE